MAITRREFLTASGAMLYGSTVNPDSSYMNCYLVRPYIVDHTHELDPKFALVKRQSTPFVILHCTTEGEEQLQKSIRDLLQADQNAHYLISRKGVIHQNVPDDCVGSHAGASRWGGYEDINWFSIGIEFVGTTYEAFTPEQYEAFRWLYHYYGLKKKYGIQDRNVVFHSQTAYCRDEEMHRRDGLLGRHEGPHRDRRTDPGFLFNRVAAGLADAPDYDPNVRRGDLLPGENRVWLRIYPEQHELAICVHDHELRDMELERRIISLSKRGPPRKGRYSISKKIRSADAHLFGAAYMEASGDKDSFKIHGTPPHPRLRFNLLMRNIMHKVRPGYNDWTADGNVAMDNDELMRLYLNLYLGTLAEVV